MNNLETLAKELFEKYTRKEHGKMGLWMYLGKQRKIDWMTEVLYTAEHVLEKLKKQIKPVGILPRGSTSYTMGYNEAIRSERIRLLNIINDTHQTLLENLDDFKIERKKRR